MSNEGGIPLKNKIMYSLGELYGGGSFLLIGTLYLKYLTDTILLAGTLAGLILLIGKLWDAVTDPLMGLISDRTQSRYGRRRVYFLLGIVPIAVSFILLWVPVTGFNTAGKFAYYLFAQLFFRTAFTLVMVPYSTLMAEMSDNYAERTRLAGVKIAFSNIGGLVSGVLPLLIVTRFLDPRLGYLVMGIVFGLFYALPWILVFLGTWESSRHDLSGYRQANRHPHLLVWHNLKQALRNRSFRIQIGLYVCSYVALDLIMALTIYFLTYYLRMEQHFNAVLGIMVITQTLFLPIYISISNRLGKKYGFMLGIAIWLLACLASLLLQPEPPVFLVYLLGFFFGLGASGGTFGPWAMLPEITDVDELMYCRRREGLYSGFMTFIRKIAQSLALAAIGLCLDLIGYVPNVEQNSATLLRLRLLYALCPALLFVLALLFALRFPVSPAYHKLLMQEIARRRSGVMTEPDAEVKRACEEMTGLDYDGLWELQKPGLISAVTGEMNQ